MRRITTTGTRGTHMSESGCGQPTRPMGLLGRLPLWPGHHGPDCSDSPGPDSYPAAFVSVCTGGWNRAYDRTSTQRPPVRTGTLR